MSDKIPLEPGLIWFFENQPEIEAKEIPIEKSHALAYAAGMEAGKHLICEVFDTKNIFKRSWV